MAWVYAAQDLHLDRRVALKQLRPQMASMSARFEREARAAGALQHPAVVKVFGHGQVDEGAYIVFEFARGETLMKLLERSGPMSPQRIAHLLRPVVGALAEAHQAGVVHRDLKPENLIMQRGAGLDEHLRLLDFGIAAVADAEERLTLEGEIFGTPSFMAPEQALGASSDARVDVWAMGVVIYQMLTGQLPFQGAHIAAILFKIVNEPLPPLPSDLDPRFAQLLSSCLEKKPERRLQDAGALLRSLESFVAPTATVIEGQQQIKPEEEPSTKLPKSFNPRWALLLSLGAGAGLLLGFLLLLLLQPKSGAKPEFQAVLQPEPNPQSDSPQLDGELQPKADLQAKSGFSPEPLPQRDASLPPTPLPNPLARGEALLQIQDTEAALAWLSQHPELGTLPARARLKGLCLLQRGSRPEGLKLLSAALKAAPQFKEDPLISKALLEALPHKDAEAAIDLLGGPLFSVELEAKLQELSNHAKNRARWRAVEVIEKGGGDLHRAKVSAYMRNLRSDTCATRRRAAQQLGKLRDPRALPALRRMEQRAGPFDGLCMKSAGESAIYKLKKLKKQAEQ